MLHISDISPRQATFMTGVLGLLTLFPPLATDMYLSAIGDLAHSMNASHSAAELSLSLFFLGLCIGQLIVGPLIDVFGRKVPLMMGITLYIVTSIVLIFVNDIAIFNTLRLFQAIGACAGMVVGRAIVSDLYQGREAAKVMNALVMILTLGPIISPTAGSILQALFGWHSIFIAMGIIGMIAFALTAFIIPETLPPQKRKQEQYLKSTYQAFKRVLGNWSFMKMALITGFVQGGMFAFITGSSRIFQEGYHLTPIQYGGMFALVAGALLLLGQVNKILLNHYDPAAILKQGLRCHLLVTATLVLLSSTTHMWLFVAPLWLSIGMVGLLSANAMSLAMAAVRKDSGTASALLGAIQFGIAFSVSASVAAAGEISQQIALPMALGISLPCLVAIALFEASKQRSTNS